MENPWDQFPIVEPAPPEAQGEWDAFPIVEPAPQAAPVAPRTAPNQPMDRRSWLDTAAQYGGTTEIDLGSGETTLNLPDGKQERLSREDADYYAERARLWGKLKTRPKAETEERMVEEAGLKNLGPLGQVAAGGAQGFRDVIALPTRLMNDDAADELMRKNAVTDKAASDISDDSMWAAAVRGVSRSLPQAFIGGGGGGAIALAASTAANNAISEGREKGLRGADLVQYATWEGAIEGGVAAIFQKAGLGGLEKSVKGVVDGALRTTLKEFLKDTGVELTEEIITEVAHSVNKSLSSVDENALNGDQLWKTVQQTALQTIMSMGAARATPAVVSGAQKAGDVLSQVPAALETATNEVDNAVADAMSPLEKWLGEHPNTQIKGDSRKAFLDAGVPKEVVDNTAKEERMAALEKLQTQPKEYEEPTDPYTEDMLKADLKKMEDATPNVDKRDSILNMPNPPLFPDQATKVGYKTPQEEIVESDPTEPTVETPIPVVKESLNTETNSPEKPDSSPTYFNGKRVDTPVKIPEKTLNEAPPSQETEKAAEILGTRSGDTTRVGYKAVNGRVVPPKTDKFSDDAKGPISYKLSDDAPESKVNTEHVQNTFPGAKVKEADGGWRVTFKGGNYLDIRQRDKINIDWKQAEAQMGKKITPAMKKKIVAAGSFELKSKDGKTMSGLGLIQLASGKADDGTLRHEALHFARQMGLFTDAEWKALTAQYSKDGKSDIQQEEDVADARGAWQSLQKKVADWAEKLMVKIGLKKGLTGEEVQQLMDTSGFWERVPKVKNGVKTVTLNFGRPDLANVGESEGVRDIQDEVDQERKEVKLPGTREDEDVSTEAQKRLKKDYEGEKKKLLNSTQLNDVETEMAREIINREGEKALKTGDKRDLVAVMNLMDSYRAAGSEQARAFRQRRDRVMTPAQRLAEAVLEMPAKYQLLIEEAKGDKKKIQDIREKWAEEVGADKAKLKERGYDIDDPKVLNDPIQAAAAFKELTAIRSTAWDVFKEFRYSAMLSNPTGIVADTLSNTAHYFYRRAMVRPVEMLLNAATGRKDGAQLGEFKHVLAGMGEGLSLAVKNTLATLKSEESTLEKSTGREAADVFDSSKVAVGGLKGRALRIPSTLRRAGDEMVKSMVARMEVGAEAYRIAKKEGLTGEALEKRIAEQVKDVQSDAWGNAIEEAQRVGFQQKLGKTGKTIQGIVNTPIEGMGGVQPGNLLIPFFKTPVNILKAGVRATPGLGLVPLALKRDSRTMEHVAQQIIGAAIFGLAWKWLEEDKIKGTLPMSSGGKDATFRDGGPTTLRIGNKTINYGRIEPLGTVMPILVDAYNAYRSDRGLDTVLAGIAQQTENKTFMRGLADLNRLVDQYKKGNASGAMADFAAGQVSSLVPSAVKQYQRASQDIMPEKKAKTTDRTFSQRVLERSLEPAGTAAIDLWGREKKRSEGGFAYKMLSPLDVRTVEDVKADKVLRNYNKVSEKPYNPEEPEASFTLNGQKKTLSDKEFNAYSKLAGETARKALDKIKLNEEKPTEFDIEVIKDVLSASRKLAKSLYAKDSPPKTDDLAKSLLKDLVSKKRDVLDVKRPAMVTKTEKAAGLSLKQKIENWKKSREEAKNWLTALKP